MNIDKIIVRHSPLTNDTAGLLISLITCSETAVHIRIGSISLYFPDCMFGEDRSRQYSVVRDYLLDRQKIEETLQFEYLGLLSNTAFTPSKSRYRVRFVILMMTKD